LKRILFGIGVSKRPNRAKPKGDNRIYYFIINNFMFDFASIGYFSKKDIAEIKVWRVRE
jgi:hypothetical protein